MEFDIITSKKTDDLDRVISIVKSFGGSRDDIQRIRAYIKNEFLELGDNRILFLLNLKEHGTVGCVQLILKNADSDLDLANGKDVAHVHALQINKNFHRMGLASKLMLELESVARSMGIERLTLGVDGDNSKAISLYKKLDYSLLKKAEGRDKNIPLYYKYKNI